jgi:SAM-dependent methyltransferase
MAVFWRFVLQCGKSDFRLARMDETSPSGSYLHSVALQGETDDGRLFSPSAARNATALVAALLPHLPLSGYALEVASGTGEHVVQFAENSPGLIWQPSDIEDERLASIAAWTAFSGLPNIAPPLAYDGVALPWPGPAMHFIFISNLIHLLSAADSARLLSHLAGALVPGGQLAIYGPFKRGKNFVSQGDEAFDASLRQRDSAIGYKDIGAIEAALARNKLNRVARIDMPANNLLTLWRSP